MKMKISNRAAVLLLLTAVYTSVLTRPKAFTFEGIIWVLLGFALVGFAYDAGKHD